MTPPLRPYQTMPPDFGQHMEPLVIPALIGQSVRQQYMGRCFRAPVWKLRTACELAGGTWEHPGYGSLPCADGAHLAVGMDGAHCASATLWSADGRDLASGIAMDVPFGPTTDPQLVANWLRSWVIACNAYLQALSSALPASSGSSTTPEA